MYSEKGLYTDEELSYIETPQTKSLNKLSSIGKNKASKLGFAGLDIEDSIKFISSIEDGDSIKSVDGKNYKLNNKDAYETYRPPSEDKEFDDAQKRRVDKQRFRLAKSLGVKPEDISAGDVYQRGAYDKLQTYASLTNADFEPDIRDLEYYRNNALPKLTQDEPIPVYGKFQDTTDVENYGRGLFETDLLSNNNIGSFDNNVEENAFADQEIARRGADGQDGYFGDLVDRSQASFHSLFDNAVEGIADGTASAVGATTNLAKSVFKNFDKDYHSLDVGSDEWNKSRDEFSKNKKDTFNDIKSFGDKASKFVTGTDNLLSKDYKKLHGVSKKSIDDMERDSKLAEKAMDDGRYDQAFLHGIEYALPYLADSSADIASFVNPYTFALGVTARVNRKANEFSKNNDGKKWNAGQTAKALGIEYALAKAELGLIKKVAKGTGLGQGLSKLADDTLSGGNKAISKTQSMKKRAGNVLLGGAGEFLQEYADASTTDLITQKEGSKTLSDTLLNKNNLFQALVGSGTGASMSLAGNTAGAGLDKYNDSYENKILKKQSTAHSNNEMVRLKRSEEEKIDSILNEGQDETGYFTGLDRYDDMSGSVFSEIKFRLKGIKEDVDKAVANGKTSKDIQDEIDKQLKDKNASYPINKKNYDKLVLKEIKRREDASKKDISDSNIDDSINDDVNSAFKEEPISADVVVDNTDKIIDLEGKILSATNTFDNMKKDKNVDINIINEQERIVNKYKDDLSKLQSPSANNVSGSRLTIYKDDFRDLLNNSDISLSDKAIIATPMNSRATNILAFGEDKLSKSIKNLVDIPINESGSNTFILLPKKDNVSAGGNSEHSVAIQKTIASIKAKENQSVDAYTIPSDAIRTYSKGSRDIDYSRVIDALEANGYTEAMIDGDIGSGVFTKGGSAIDGVNTKTIGDKTLSRINSARSKDIKTNKTNNANNIFVVERDSNKATITKDNIKAEANLDKRIEIQDTVKYIYDKKGVYNKAFTNNVVQRVQATIDKFPIDSKSLQNLTKRNLLAVLVDSDGKLLDGILENAMIQVPLTFRMMDNVSDDFENKKDFGENVQLQVYYNTLGRNIIDASGIRVNFEVDSESQRSILESSLGEAITSALIEAGVFEVKTLREDGKTTSYLRDTIKDDSSSIRKKIETFFGAEGDVKSLEKHNKVNILEIGSNLLKMSYNVTNVEQLMPTQEPTVNKIKTKNNSKISEKMQGNINTMNNVPNTFKDIATTIFNMPKHQVLSLMGYVDLERVDLDGIDSKTALNESLSKAYNDAMKVYSRNKEGKPFYFSYFFSRVGRLFINENVMNPINDKQLARNIINFGGKKQIVTDENMNTFFRAIGSQLGIKIEHLNDDRVSDEIYRIVNENMNLNDWELTQKYKGKDGLAKFIAYKELARYISRNKEDVFETDVQMSVDGSANGLFFTFMNFIGDVELFKKYANALGIFIPSSDNKNAFEYYENNGLDVYNIFGSKLGETKYDMLESFKSYEDGGNLLSSVLNNTIDTILGSKTTEPLIGIRKMSKLPVMIFSYMAGKNVIKKDVADAIYDDLVDLINFGSERESKTAFKTLVEIAKPNHNISKKELLDQYNKFVHFGMSIKSPQEGEIFYIAKNVNTKDVIISRLSNTYGQMMFLMLEKELSPLKTKLTIVSDALSIAGNSLADFKNQHMIKKNFIKNRPEGTKPEDIVYFFDNIDTFFNTPDGSLLPLSSSDFIVSRNDNGTFKGLTNNDIAIGARSSHITYAGSAVRINQSSDASTMGSIHDKAVDGMLPMFDGIYTNINDAKTLQDEYNKSAKYENYNHIGTTIESLERSLETYKSISQYITNYLKKADDGEIKITKSAREKLVNELDRMKVDFEIGKSKTKNSPEVLSIVSFISELKSMLDNVNRMKEELGFSEASIQQISGAYDMGDTSPNFGYSDIDVNVKNEVPIDVKSKKPVRKNKTFNEKANEEKVNKGNNAKNKKIKDTLSSLKGQYDSKDKDGFVFLEAIANELDALFGKGKIKINIGRDTRDSDNTFNEKNLTINLSGKDNSYISDSKNKNAIHEILHAMTSLGLNTEREALTKYTNLLRRIHKKEFSSISFEDAIGNNSLSKQDLALIYIATRKNNIIAQKELVAIFGSDSDFRSYLSKAVDSSVEMNIALKAFKAIISIINQTIDKLIKKSEYFRRVSDSEGLTTTGKKARSDKAKKMYKDIFHEIDKAKDISKEYIDAMNTKDKNDEDLNSPSYSIKDSDIYNSLTILNKGTVATDAVASKYLRRLYNSNLTKASIVAISDGYKKLYEEHPSVRHIAKFMRDNIIESDFIKRVLVDNNLDGSVDRNTIDKLLTLDQKNQERANNASKEEHDDTMNTFGDLSKEDQQLLTKSFLSSDIKVLFDGSVLQDVFYEFINMDKDEQADYLAQRVAHISKTSGKIDKKLLTKIIKNSGQFAINKNADVNGYVFHNAISIGRQFKIDDQDVVSDIDILISLSALYESGGSALLKKIDKKKLEKLSDKHKAIEAYQFDYFGSDRYKIRKGWFVNNHHRNYQIIFMDKKEYRRTKKDSGYKVIGERDGLLLVKRVDLSGAYVSGALSLNSATPTGYQIPNSDKVKSVEKGIKMFGKNAVPRRGYVVREKDGMPVETYEITGWNYEVNNEDKNQHSEMDNNIVDVISKTYNSVMVKSSSSMLNNEIMKKYSLNFISDSQIQEGDDVEVEQYTKESKEQLKKELDEKNPLIFTLEGFDDDFGVGDNVEGYVRVDPKEFSISKNLSFAGINDTSVLYVKKGTNDILLGYKENFIFDNRNVRYYETLYKGIVSQMKQNVTIKSPAVQKVNLLSNMFILSVIGVPVYDIIKYGKEFNDNKTKYDKLSMKIDSLERRNKAKKDKKVQDRIDKLRIKLEENPLHKTSNAGLFQTIDSQLRRDNMISNDAFLSEVSNIVDKMGLNKHNEYVKKIKKPLEVLNKKVKIKDSDTSINDLSKNLIENIVSMDPTIGNLLSELYMSRRSATGNTVGVGVSMIDQASRHMLLSYLLSIGQSQQEASQMALDVFVDYRRNLPRELNVFSSYAWFPFITWYMRIQRVLIYLLINKPVSSIIGQVLVSGDVDTFRSNIVEAGFDGLKGGLGAEELGTSLVPAFYR